MSVETGKRVLEIEAEAILEMAGRIGDDFLLAIDIVMACKGKVIVAGIGKSGHVCRKIAATLASTGTPAFFVHPAEGVHGDVGMIDKNDAALVVSNSGETEELLAIVPVLKRLGLPIIGLLGKRDSSLARSCDAVIDVSVKEEACPLKLAPTASTTAALAMGDALAVALLERRGFTADDFALRHPAGSLGKKLLYRVSDLMRTGDEAPAVSSQATFNELICEMNSKMLGHAMVVDGGELKGIVSDGDLRRSISRDEQIHKKRAGDIMTANPKFILPDNLAAKALQLMEKHSITALPVLEDAGGKKPVGIIHLHDLLKAGVV